MEDPGVPTRNPSLPGAIPDSEPAPKRRKLRKGTRSCWECKRRKARCTFAADTEDVCDSCKRRGTDCVSQEVAEKPPPPGSNRHLIDRLGRVEALVGGLLEATRSNERPGGHAPSPTRSGSRRRTYRDGPGRSQTPAARSDDLFHSLAWSDSSVVHTRDSHNQVDAPHSGPSSTTGRYDDLFRNLLAAWPSPDDMDIILATPVETSSIIRAVTCTQPTVSTDEAIPSPGALLKLPPLGSHPVLVARKLLILVTFLQGIPSSHAKHLQGLSLSRDEMMARAVTTAHALVTCNDELLGSIEGIQCILLEGQYENYAGNLRRSWLATRRAITIAQMLGLDRGAKPPALTSAVVDPDHMWFRVIQFDRYLCLMLGLPQSVPEDQFASSDALASCPASERFQRLTCAASGRLLRRDRSDICDSVVTKEVDRMLQDASAKMPAQWWVTPNLSTCEGHMERIRETLRFNDHFMHYHLLVQLHLPYLVHSASDRRHMYNRMTALTTSREVLSRLVSFRACLAVGYYCRGMDILAFISSTALSLAYINDQKHPGADDEGSHFLTHQRRSDRGILERTLGIMQELALLHNDVIATQVATLLQHLLAIEEDVASGSSYEVTFAPEPREKDLGCTAKMSDDSSALSIYLPHLPVIKIERRGPQSKACRTPASLGSSRAQNTPGNYPGQPLTISECDSEDLDRRNESMPLNESLATDGNYSGYPRGLSSGGEFLLEQNPSSWAFQDIDLGFLDNLIEVPTDLEAHGVL